MTIWALSNTAMSWMKDFFSKHGECMPNRETIHILDNLSRREIIQRICQRCRRKWSIYCILMFSEDMEERNQQCLYS